jgi:hypothetical protein
MALPTLVYESETRSLMTEDNKKFWEDLIAYFPWYDADHTDNDAQTALLLSRVYSLQR